MFRVGPCEAVTFHDDYWPGRDVYLHGCGAHLVMGLWAPTRIDHFTVGAIVTQNLAEPAKD
jgi:hypothetical protein